MKKITILALHLGYGGIEQYILSLCKMFSEDYKIDIISTYKIYDKPVFEFPKNVSISYLINGGPNKTQLRKEISSKNLIGIIKQLVISAKIIANKYIKNIIAIKKINSDYIITTRDFHNKLVGKFANKKIIKIATEHNYHNNNIRYVNKIVNSVKKMNYLVVVSKNLQEYYSKKIKKVKCIYISNVLDKMPEKKSDLKNNNLICVGRLSPEKGQLDLLNVVRYLKEKNSNIKLYLIGDGILMSELKLKIQELNLENNVELLGFKSKKEIEKYMLNSSVFVLPSYSESFGLVLIEAMSYGVPCVAFDSSDGACELLKNNIGILVKNRDTKDMAIQIEKIFEDAKLKLELSNNGYNYCKRFLMENIKKEWEKILK